MTTYNGTNMGLEQNADGTWVFTNPAQTFIDPASFSTPDPEFPTAPVDDEEEEDTTCEEGFIYDNTLKQCVPEVTEYEQVYQGYTGTKEQEIIPGTGRLLDTNISPNIGGTNLFPYATTASTRAQMNEHMLLMEGVNKGWLQLIDKNNPSLGYTKVPFNERQGESIGWAGSAMKYFNRKSYDDYFKILNEGWQPEGDGLWDKFLQGNNVYSLQYSMRKSSVDGPVDMQLEVYNYSPEFQAKIDQATKINNGMIDRDGNVNINADGKGGYYNEDGKFVNEYGQVSASGSLSSGLSYLFNLEKSGLKLPENLKQRLIKDINTKALSYQQQINLAKQLGYNTWQEVVNKANNAISNSDAWSMADVTEDVVDDVIESVEDFEIDDAGGVGDWEPPGPKPHWDWMGAPGTGSTEPEETGGGEWEPTSPPRAEDKPGGGEFSWPPSESESFKKAQVKKQAQKMVDKGKEVPTGTGQLLGSAFDKDKEKVGGKSYTQSKLEEAAKTGKYTGF